MVSDAGGWGHPPHQFKSLMAPKITILFYSTYGTNHSIAQEAARAAEEVGVMVVP